MLADVPEGAPLLRADRGGLRSGPMAADKIAAYTQAAAESGTQT